jgi:hypothetical protein
MTMKTIVQKTFTQGFTRKTYQGTETYFKGQYRFLCHTFKEFFFSPWILSIQKDKGEVHFIFLVVRYYRSNKLKQRCIQKGLSLRGQPFLIYLEL